MALSLSEERTSKLSFRLTNSIATPLGWDGNTSQITELSPWFKGVHCTMYITIQWINHSPVDRQCSLACQPSYI